MPKLLISVLKLGPSSAGLSRLLLSASRLCGRISAGHFMAVRRMSSTSLASIRRTRKGYRPEVLWYFGHLARLQHDAAVERLREADHEYEAKALSYNVIDLSARVLRKHRLVNRGWALTALELIAIVAAGTSFFIRAQL